MVRSCQGLLASVLIVVISGQEWLGSLALVLSVVMRGQQWSGSFGFSFDCGRDKRRTDVRVTRSQAISHTILSPLLLPCTSE